MTNKFMKNTARGILIGGLAVSLLTGCKRETRTELSEVLHEDAVVTSRDYTSRWVQILPCGKTIIPITHPESYSISFDGKIDFDSSDEEVYSRFKEGDTADVSYREVYKLIFEDLDKDGKKEQIGRVFDGYEFEDACPKQQK